MNLSVIIPIVLVIALLGFVRRVPMLACLVVWWLSMFVLFTRGINPPVPSSLVGMFMTIITIALITYVLADQKRSEEVFGPIKKFLTLKKFQVPLGLVLIIIPLLVGFRTYKSLSAGVSPPFLSRTIHPAPPGSIDFNPKGVPLGEGKQVDLSTVANPYRELEHSDPEKFRQHADRGKEIYYQNCFFCHGDNLDGKGMFAHGLDPLPANFQDSGTIVMLEEGFLFWRIAKGGPGLPEEATPWSSSMPAWENFLSEEDIWDVILFLYDFTDQKPRAKEEVH